MKSKTYKLNGKLPKGCTGKDVFLYIAGVYWIGGGSMVSFGVILAMSQYVGQGDLDRGSRVEAGP